MFKFALSCTLLAGAIWAVAFYKMGDKPLAGHLEEIYQTPLVQQKIEALQQGVGQRIYGAVEKNAVEKRKTVAKARPMAAVEPAPPEVIDARPQTGHQQKGPAHDTLTEDDRDGLNDLLSRKLKK